MLCFVNGTCYILIRHILRPQSNDVASIYTLQIITTLWFVYLILDIHVLRFYERTIKEGEKNKLACMSAFIHMLALRLESLGTLNPWMY